MIKRNFVVNKINFLVRIDGYYFILLLDIGLVLGVWFVFV